MSLRNNISEVYNYTNLDGTIVYQTVRYIPKSFKHRRVVHGTPETYIWGLSQGYYTKNDEGDYYRSQYQYQHPTNIYVSAVKHHYPYHIHNILNNQRILLCEGEKDVHTAEHIHFAATTNSGGSGSFTHDIVQYFKNKDIVILTDNDHAGYIGSLKRAHILRSIAKSIQILPPFPNLPQHSDISQWIESLYGISAAHLTSQQQHDAHNILYRMIKFTPYWTDDTLQNDVSTVCKKKKYYTPSQQQLEQKNILLSFQNVKQQYDNAWLALCPAHDDQKHSLSIRKTPSRYLIHCFAGCTTEDILKSAHLSFTDLFIHDTHPTS